MKIRNKLRRLSRKVAALPGIQGVLSPWESMHMTRAELAAARAAGWLPPIAGAMPYDNVISRTDAQATIPEQVSQAMLKSLVDQSWALSKFPRVPVATNQTRFPVLAALPTSYFVNGDTGLKQTTEVRWADKFIDIEELAAIVPIPEAVLDDSSFDVWGAVRPLLEQSIGRALDDAIVFGTNAPTSWPDDLVTGATAAGHTVTRGTATAAQGGVAEDFSDLYGTIENDGYDPSTVAAARSVRSVLRGVRDANGNRLPEVSPEQVWGVDVSYPMRGLWPTTAGTAEAVAGDTDQVVVGVRQDFTYKILDQAVIQDNTGAIIYNLAQQDMVALRVVFRVGWQIANTINYDEPTEANRYPFGIMLRP